MTRNWSYLEHFFRESFLEGQTRRELRLSQEEQRYLQDKYPRVVWQSQSEPVGEKTWFQVTLPPAAETAAV